MPGRFASRGTVKNANVLAVVQMHAQVEVCTGLEIPIAALDGKWRFEADLAGISSVLGNDANLVKPNPFIARSRLGGVPDLLGQVGNGGSKVGVDCFVHTGIFKKLTLL